MDDGWAAVANGRRHGSGSGLSLGLGGLNMMDLSFGPSLNSMGMSTNTTTTNNSTSTTLTGPPPPPPPGLTRMGSLSSNAEARLYTCGRCVQAYPTLDALTKHIIDANHHRCKNCRKDFDTRADYLVHRSMCTAGLQRSISSGSAGGGSLTTPRRTYMCGFEGCNRVFADTTEFNEHLAQERHYFCIACKQRFESRSWQTTHVCPSISIPSSREEDASTNCNRARLSQSSSGGPPSSPRDVEMRRDRLRQLAQRPGTYSPQGKKRFVFMDTDNIVFALANSTHIHEQIPHATSPRDLRLNFDKFTKRICNSPDGGRSPEVQMLKATYYGAASVLAEGLARSGWAMEKQETVSDVFLQNEIKAKLSWNDTSCSRVLVLVTGDGNVAANGHSFRMIIDQFLQLNWCVEIFSWLHSLNDGYLDYMEQYPAHVFVQALDDGDVRDIIFAANQPPSPPPVGSYLPRSESGGRVGMHQPEELMAALRRENELLHDKVHALESQLGVAASDKEESLRRIHSLTDEHSQQQHESLMAKWKAFDKRKEALTCRITGSLFEQPVILSCCQQTVSKGALARLHQQTTAMRCPFCQATGFTTLPNRAVDEILRIFLQQIPE